MRFYIGVFNLIQQNGRNQTIQTERYCGWKVSAEAAKGEWVSHAMNANPGFNLVGAFVDDVTDCARADPQLNN